MCRCWSPPPTNPLGQLWSGLPQWLLLLLRGRVILLRQLARLAPVTRSGRLGLLRL
jgi:hypothetical protein